MRTADNNRLFMTQAPTCLLQGGRSAATLDAILDRGYLLCGVNVHLAGFALPESPSRWSGFNVDYGHAIAAAIFGDPGRVKFVPLDAGARFRSLATGEVDVLVRNASWTLTRECSLGIDFVNIVFYETQGAMVARSRDAASLADLDGCTLCITRGDAGDTNTTSGDNIAEYFDRHGLAWKGLYVHDDDDALMAYLNGECDVFTSGVAGLHAERMRVADPEQHVILPDVIAHEPLAIAVREGDAQWAKLIRWVHFALLGAEACGVDSTQAGEILRGRPGATEHLSPDARRLTGIDGQLGAQLGLMRQWALQAIAGVGNYGEIFSRNFGEESDLQMPRGLNRLWRDGGLHYAPSFK